MFRRVQPSRRGLDGTHKVPTNNRWQRGEKKKRSRKFGTLRKIYENARAVDLTCK